MVRSLSPEEVALTYFYYSTFVNKEGIRCVQRPGEMILRSPLVLRLEYGGGYFVRNILNEY